MGLLHDADPEGDIEETMASSTTDLHDPRKELSRLLDELEIELKRGGVVAALTGRGVNASLALVALHGLRAYVIEDKKAQAAEDFATVSEEIFARLAASVIYEGGGGGGSGG